MSSASMECTVKVTSQQTPHRSAPLTADSAALSDPHAGYSFCLLQASRGGHGVQCSPSGRIGARATVWAQELERYGR